MTVAICTQSLRFSLKNTACTKCQKPDFLDSCLFQRPCTVIHRTAGGIYIIDQKDPPDPLQIPGIRNKSMLEILTPLILAQFLLGCSTVNSSESPGIHRQRQPFGDFLRQQCRLIKTSLPLLSPAEGSIAAHAMIQSSPCKNAGLPDCKNPHKLSFRHTYKQIYSLN